ncbi:hypothetical protein M9Y10_001716 [Tritrichomonas musculus]|uniref:Uncharacterized protein n=1 Tax=Tritrichomonas musculus TaxID=1915356 RepID=A0ABR2L7R2_9EUKA
MFQSPKIIKVWEIMEFDLAKIIIPISLDHIIDIKADDENILIRTFKLQQKQSADNDTVPNGNLPPMPFKENFQVE